MSVTGYAHGLVDNSMSDDFSARSVNDICFQTTIVTSYCQAVCLLELLMLKHGILLVPGIVFSTRDIDDAMHVICNDWC